MATNYLINGAMYIPAVYLVPGGIYAAPSYMLYGKTNLTPAVTGSAILDLFTLPGGMLQNHNGLYIWGFATTAANTNSKTLSINFAATGAIGAAPTGGTAIVSVVTTTSGQSLLVETWVYRTAANAQTYAGYSQAAATQGTPTTGTLTVTDTSAIQINLVVNDATAAGDATVQFWGIQFLP